MKETGEPDRPGETLHQAGATAVAVPSPLGGLVWQVRQHRDGRVVVTNCLAHTGHWEPEHRWELGS